MLSNQYDREAYDQSTDSTTDIKKTVGIRICDLDISVNEHDLNKVFGKFGGLHSVRVIRDQELGISLGYGYANYSNIKSALQAKQCFHNMLIKGKQISIKMLNYEYPTETPLPVNRFLHVNFLDYNVEEKTLWETFSPFGIVESVEILPRKGSSKLKAVVEFKNVKDATAALNELDGMTINDSAIKISYYLCLNNNKPSKSKEEALSDPHKPSLPPISSYVPVSSPTTTSTDSPSLSKKTLIVTGIQPLVKNIELNILFDLYGEVLSCRIDCDPSGKLRGLVEFKNEGQANNAKVAIDGMVFRDSKLNVEFYDPNVLPMELENTNYTLKISNLNPIITEEHLKYVFEPHGTICNSSLIKDGNNEPICFGYLTFSTFEESKRAKQAMHNKMISGKVIKVDFLDSNAGKESITQPVENNKTYPVKSYPRNESTRVWNFPYNSKTYTDYDSISQNNEIIKQDSYSELLSSYEADTKVLTSSLKNISLEEKENQEITKQLQSIIKDKNPNYENELLAYFQKSSVSDLRKMLDNQDGLDAKIDAAFDKVIRDLMSD